jgi:hypothetical protein
VNIANIENLLSRLEGVKRTAANKWLAKCPLHDDRHASFGVKLTDDGAILMHCFAGCDTGAILAVIGLSFCDLFPPRSAHDIDPTKPRPKTPRFSARELLSTLIFESTVLALAIEYLQNGIELSDVDAARVAQAKAAIDGIRREVGNGFV